jgi:hypothetical protein
MRRYPPSIRFASQSHNPAQWYCRSSPRPNRITITLPDLPDDLVRCWHGFLRECLLAFEEHYEDQLARAYGWAASGDQDDEADEDETDWDHNEI